MSSRCPFWSTSKHKISCSRECPMFFDEQSEEKCIFVENCSDTKFELKGINDYSYDDDYDKEDTIVFEYVKKSASY